MQAAMPFQLQQEVNLDFKLDNKQDFNSGKSDFENVLKNKISEKSGNKNEAVDGEKEELSQGVIEELKKKIKDFEEKDEISSEDVAQMLAEIINNLKLESDDKKLMPFLEELKKSLNELNLEALNGNKNELIDELKQNLKQNGIDKKLEFTENQKDKFDLKFEIKEIFSDKSKNFSEDLNKKFNFNLKDILNGIKSEDNIEKEKDNKLKFSLEKNTNILDVKSSHDNKINEKLENIKIEKPQDILKLVDSINLAKSAKTSKITVQLSPAELGKVNIQLTESAGKVTAKFFVEHDATKSMLLQQADAIKNQLSQKGIVVDDMQFMFSGDFSGRENFSQQSKSQQNQKSFKIDEDNVFFETVNNIDKTGLYA